METDILVTKPESKRELGVLKIAARMILKWILSH
jgi:hypothetical protein